MLVGSGTGDGGGGGGGVTSLVLSHSTPDEAVATQPFLELAARNLPAQTWSPPKPDALLLTFLLSEGLQSTLHVVIDAPCRATAPRPNRVPVGFGTWH